MSGLRTEPIEADAEQSIPFGDSPRPISDELSWGYRSLAVAGLLLDATSLAGPSNDPTAISIVGLAVCVVVLFAMRFLRLWGEYAFVLLFLAGMPLGYTIDFATPTVGIYGICAAWIGRKRFVQAFLLFVLSQAVSYVQAPEDPISTVAFNIVFWLLAILGAGLGILFYRTRIRTLHGVAEEWRATARESEDRVRHQIATDLHDSTARDLAHLALQAQHLADQESASPDELRALAELASGAARKIRPLILQIDAERESATIAEASELSATMLKSRSIALKSEIPEGVDEELSRQQRLTGSLIIREAATNILKYAPAASEAELEVEHDDEGTLSILVISDISPEPLAPTAEPGSSGGFGIANLADRVESEGGTFTFGAAGTRWIVNAILPSYKEPLP